MKTFTDWRGETVSVGDDVITERPHRIVRIEAYDPPMFPGEKWVIARDADGWGITLEGK